jgi:hypothetical protein
LSGDYDDLTRVIREFKQLDKYSVKVGALKTGGGRSEEFMEMIAMVNEKGCHIKAINHKYLTIPTKDAGRRTAREIPNLFFHWTKQHHLPTLCQNVNGQVKIMFYLKTSVDIPKRSFLRTTFDEKEATDWTKRVDECLNRMMDGDMTAKELYADLGRLMVKDVQRAIYKATPGNSPLTIARKGKDTPLRDTGALYRSIDWVVVEK